MPDDGSQWLENETRSGHKVRLPLQNTIRLRRASCQAQTGKGIEGAMGGAPLSTVNLRLGLLHPYLSNMMDNESKLN